MTDSLDDPVELLDVDGGPKSDMGEWIPTPDMEDEARFFNDGDDPWDDAAPDHYSTPRWT